MKKPLTIGSLKSQSASAAGSENDVPPNAGKTTANVAEPHENHQVNTIYIIQNGTAYSVRLDKYMTLLDSALQQGNKIDFKCKKGTCGRCKVQLLKGMSILTEPNDQEEEKLDNLIDQGFRLACQSRLK
ncbi:2Fe-2S iron-sulfur cluster-binding protein [Alkalihalobacillus sp. TS-13]|uniref:2Fe-2S iron-sulfur cluster-binding protein n=1 Tax=Alkalihalobacillus sp. TS-13 TaxID=2842455 RepID=UPI001C88B9C9|nr:2Fe-2S iron-sulfur cluster-binding protein [Alkalihalobacillus sp. TS-13]